MVKRDEIVKGATIVVKTMPKNFPSLNWFGKQFVANSAIRIVSPPKKCGGLNTVEVEFYDNNVIAGHGDVYYSFVTNFCRTVS